MEEQNGESVGVPPPPPVLDPSGFCEVRWAKVGEPIRMICLSDAIYGRELHWVGQQSQLCEAPKAPCALCKLEYKKRWYAWLLGHCIQTGEVILTHVALESYRRCAAIQSGGLCGRMIRMERPNRARAKVDITVVGSARHSMQSPISLEQVERFVEEAYARMRIRKGGK